MRVANGDRPGAPADVRLAVNVPACPGGGERGIREVVARGQDAILAVVATRLTGKRVGQLDVAAVEHIVRRGRKEAGDAIQRVPRNASARYRPPGFKEG